HAKAESEVTSLAPESPNREAYYVQSPSRESNSFRSTPIHTPLGSPARASSSSSFKIGSQKSNRRHDGTEFDAIEEETLLEDDDDDTEGRRTRRSCRCYSLAFAVGFLALFSFFALVLFAVSRNQKPIVSMKSIVFDSFVIQAGTDATGVSTDMVTMNSTVKFHFLNKGSFFGVGVTSTPLDLSYSALTLAVGSVDEFYQGRKSGKIVTVAVTGREIPLYGGGADLRSQNGAPVPLTISFTLRSRGYVLGRLVKPKFYNRILCSVIMDPALMNLPLPLGPNCSYN
ncbi:hypothetical protein M569_11691, partial [Genlisea aurea]